MPLEDDFCDIVKKARTGQGLSVADVARTTGLPVAFYDERFTTVEAESALWTAGLTHKRRKARRDKVAAQMLLQAYLDAGCPADAGAGPLEG